MNCGANLLEGHSVDPKAASHPPLLSRIVFLTGGSRVARPRHFDGFRRTSWRRNRIEFAGAESVFQPQRGALARKCEMRSARRGSIESVRVHLRAATPVHGTGRALPTSASIRFVDAVATLRTRSTTSNRIAATSRCSGIGTTGSRSAPPVTQAPSNVKSGAHKRKLNHASLCNCRL